MTLAEVIAKVEQTRPSSYDKNDLTQWVNEIEFQVIDQVFNKAEPINQFKNCHSCTEKETCTDYKVPEPFKGYTYDLDADAELLIPDQYSGVYTAYLYSKIDFNNAEIERYQLDSSMCEAAWQDFAAWFRRNHKPRRHTRHETTEYYKHHFKADCPCEFI